MSGQSSGKAYAKGGFAEVRELTREVREASLKCGGLRRSADDPCSMGEVMPTEALLLSTYDMGRQSFGLARQIFALPGVLDIERVQYTGTVRLNHFQLILHKVLAGTRHLASYPCNFRMLLSRGQLPGGDAPPPDFLRARAG